MANLKHVGTGKKLLQKVADTAKATGKKFLTPVGTKPVNKQPVQPKKAN